MAIASQLLNQINVDLITKEIIKLDEIRVVQKSLNFDFSGNLIYSLLFFLWSSDK